MARESKRIATKAAIGDQPNACFSTKASQYVERGKYDGSVLLA